MGRMKYFAEITDGIAYRVIRTDEDSIYERFDWTTREWVFDRNPFRSMSGIGGDGYDWYEVSQSRADELIKARLERLRSE